RYVFFFQAEDGIRDFHVTGVQTCALPISTLSLIEIKEFSTKCAIGIDKKLSKAYNIERNCKLCSKMKQQQQQQIKARYGFGVWRSEERRVGKECRSRGAQAE